MQSILWKYYEQLYANKLDNMVKMNKFLATYNPPKLIRKNQNPEETNHN